MAELLSNSHAQNALHMLADAAVNRANDLEAYPAEDIRSDTDEESDSPTPIYDSFYNSGGSAAVLSMCNFDAHEFQEVWGKISGFLVNEWNVGRARKTPYSGKDMFSIVLSVLKHGGQWDFLGRMFKIKDPMFERLVMEFLDIVSHRVYEKFVIRAGMTWSMKRLIDQKTVFKNFPYARYATDVTFQNTNRPVGALQEAKKYYSGKHKLYGYKVEVSVLPNGLSISCSDRYPGSVADIGILERNKKEHQGALQKTEYESNIMDVGQFYDEYSDFWAVLLDKGYQGAIEFSRALIPKKKPPGRHLTMD